MSTTRVAFEGVTVAVRFAVPPGSSVTEVWLTETTLTATSGSSLGSQLVKVNNAVKTTAITTATAGIVDFILRKQLIINPIPFNE